MNTGREIVTGSYDRTIRIFDSGAGKSKQCYHAKRMQRVFTVDFTADSKFILSGSDDANVRIWKSNASAALGRSKPRQHRKQNYMDQLVKRYKHTKVVKSISQHQHVRVILIDFIIFFFFFFFFSFFHNKLLLLDVVLSIG